MPNRLSAEKSPYLLQHADNPVDWYPWGEEAFRKAKEEDKPVFLSIGYATCHWCHVMERESFEDEEVAALLNEHVVAVKVDREERPDIDQIYMTVCQALLGSGGWPLSVFMTPEKNAFFAGSYFPKHARLGMAGFTDVIRRIVHMWKNDRERLLEAGRQITESIQPRPVQTVGSLPGPEVLEEAYSRLSRAFDATWGGFGSKPKFPTPHHLTFLLRWHRRNPWSDALAIVEKTLDGMRDGGIFDQVGFGFHRYSVDEKWLVPHFEKMLYDQAMLALAYLEAFQVTGRERHGRVAREIFEYVLRDMTDPDGGFYSAEDADSEGVEGRFYVWTPAEVNALLGNEIGETFCRFFDITPEGNFEDGRSIPHLAELADSLSDRDEPGIGGLEDLLEKGRRLLFEARRMRVHPLKDDKILTSWNGLMIAALSKGSRALGDRSYALAASRAADFILDRMRRDSGRLHRRYRKGEAAIHAYADDYAFFIWGLIELYEAAFDVRYLEEAVKLQDLMIDLFWDDAEGGFFFTPNDGENLIVREREIYDGAVPSSNSAAALNLLRLGRMVGAVRFEEKADRLLRRFSETVRDYPSAYTQFLHAVDFAAGPTREVVIAGSPDNATTAEMMKIVGSGFVPNTVVLLRGTPESGARLAELAPYTAGLVAPGGNPAVYICEKFACTSPITEIEELRETFG
ncbi:thioredoxin domain-containing protein [Syntrophobacter fumaroxidans]|uniref:Spermatogenesis-associated protein 20-like TRX domain-containing protein n=1 Tax=Syntrophobacter fumaroxidans (strain DSM 10017 / MPOB) TaxID=335543 RepID=A0LLC3_SYNFM|nr:thioredoxin domain-containing protein [Syntrophobacter fumaroxidans]ABK18225.1 protein of unknown function DUF255 [Syntrophobacter fumaroxidans MPOB]